MEKQPENDKLTTEEHLARVALRYEINITKRELGEASRRRRDLIDRLYALETQEKQLDSPPEAPHAETAEETNPAEQQAL